MKDTTGKHGAYLIRPHGLRRVWRVEVWQHGTYRGRQTFRDYRRALSAAAMYNTNNERDN